jgi:hypothetical protein
MDDIFDDVDSILDEGAASDEETANFNEAELHDIMSEIEDLEKEFEAEETPMSLQEKIDAELAMELEELNAVEVVEVDAVAVAMEEMKEIQSNAQVLAFEKVTPVVAPMVATSTHTVSTPASSSSGVSFQAQGQMSLNLDFMVGQESAKLVIDPVKGLVVTLSGVELCINEDSGCTVSMDNGMKFTIPLSSQVNSLKKKSA